MISLIKSYLLTSTAKDSLIMFSGTIISTLLGFFLTLILARNMSTIEFGLFITALTFTQLVTDGFEMGINPALINFIAKAKIEHEHLFLKVTFVLKVLIGTVVSAIIFCFSAPLSQLIFKSEEIRPYLQFSAFGVFFLFLTSWGQVIFQAKRRFIVAMISSVSINFFRLLSVLILLALGVFNGLNAYLLINLIMAATLLFLLSRLKLSFLKAPLRVEKAKTVLGFGLPVGISFSLAALYTRLDQILVFNMLGEKEAGIYGLAFRVASFLTFASVAVGSVTVPRFVALHRDDFGRYFKKVLLAAGGLGAVSLLAIPVAPLLLPFVFGQKFIPSIAPFQILVVGIVFFILATPFNNAILYRYKKTKFTLTVSIFSLLLVWLMLSRFIPVYKESGAAFVVTIIYFFQLILSLGYFFILVKSNAYGGRVLVEQTNS